MCRPRPGALGQGHECLTLLHGAGVARTHAPQGDGFAANYSASTTPQVFVPTCASGHKLLQVILRSRDYASEMGWVITKRQILDVFFANTPSDTNIVMAGGCAAATAHACRTMPLSRLQASC